MVMSAVMSRIADSGTVSGSALKTARSASLPGSSEPVYGEFQIRLKSGGQGLLGLRMRHLVILVVHLITTVLRLVPPGAVRAVVAESVLAKHQLLILNRSRRRAPNLRILDRLIAGFCSLWIKPSRFCRVAVGSSQRRY